MAFGTKMKPQPIVEAVFARHARREAHVLSVPIVTRASAQAIYVSRPLAQTIFKTKTKQILIVEAAPVCSAPIQERHEAGKQPLVHHPVAFTVSNYSITLRGTAFSPTAVSIKMAILSHRCGSTRVARGRRSAVHVHRGLAPKGMVLSTIVGEIACCSIRMTTLQLPYGNGTAAYGSN